MILRTLDTLHLEMTMQCSQGTAEKLQSNQGSILPRLQAVETLMQEQNLAHKNKESLIATVQHVSPPRRVHQDHMVHQHNLYLGINNILYDCCMKTECKLSIVHLCGAQNGLPD